MYNAPLLDMKMWHELKGGLYKGCKIVLLSVSKSPDLQRIGKAGALFKGGVIHPKIR